MSLVSKYSPPQSILPRKIVARNVYGTVSAVLCCGQLPTYPSAADYQQADLGLVDNYPRAKASRLE